MKLQKYEIESQIEILYHNLFQGVVITTIFMLMANIVAIDTAVLIAFIAQALFRPLLRPKLFMNIAIVKSNTGAGSSFWFTFIVVTVLFIVLNAIMTSVAATVLMQLDIEKFSAYAVSIYFCSFIDMLTDSRRTKSMIKFNEAL